MKKYLYLIGVAVALLAPGVSHAAFNFQEILSGAYAYSGTPLVEVATTSTAYNPYLGTADEYCNIIAQAQGRSDSETLWCVYKMQQSVSFGCIFDGETCGWQAGTGSTSYSAYLYSTAPAVTASVIGQTNPPYQCSNVALTYCYEYRHTPGVTATLTANPSTIARGSSSLLTWSSTGATSCTGTNFSTGGATSGSISTSPTVNTTYSVTCTGATGSANASATVTVTVPQCSDGVNNDGAEDSWVDYPNDPGCTSANDTTESPNPQCSDGANNDGDTFGADYPNDPGCSSASDTSESPNPQCSDGVNNDGSEDALVDHPADPGCTDLRDASESPNPASNPRAYIEAVPDRVNAGETTDVSFSAADVSTCSVTQNGALVWGPFAPSPAPGVVATTSVYDRVINTLTTFTISCTGASASDSVIVNVVPKFEEF